LACPNFSSSDTHYTALRLLAFLSGKLARFACFNRVQSLSRRINFLFFLFSKERKETKERKSTSATAILLEQDLAFSSFQASFIRPIKSLIRHVKSFTFACGLLFIKNVQG